MNKTIAVSLLVMLIFSACDKDKNDPQQKTTSGNYLDFYNPYEQAVYLNFVDTVGHLITNDSPFAFMEYIIPPRQTLHIPDSIVKRRSGADYAFFWVSADLQYTNWVIKSRGNAHTPELGFEMDSTTYKKIVLAAPADDLLATLGRPKNTPNFKVDFQYHKDSARYTTNFMAVNAYDSSGISIWNNLTADERYVHLYPHLWHKFSVAVKSNGTIQTDSFFYGFIDYPNSNRHFEIAGNGSHITNIQSIPFISKQYQSAPILSTTSIDTLFLWTYGKRNVIYKMAKL